jgi:hypothetical protein
MRLKWKDWRIGLGGFEWHGGAGVVGAGLWFWNDGACVTLFTTKANYIGTLGMFGGARCFYTRGRLIVAQQSERHTPALLTPPSHKHKGTLFNPKGHDTKRSTALDK